MDSDDKVEQIGAKATWEDQFELLSKKVDDQFRFTRSVIVLCTLANLGLSIFTVLATFQSLPSQITAHIMSNLEPMVGLWRRYESLLDSQDRMRAEQRKSDVPSSGN